MLYIQDGRIYECIGPSIRFGTTTFKFVIYVVYCVCVCVYNNISRQCHWLFSWITKISIILMCLVVVCKPRFTSLPVIWFTTTNILHCIVNWWYSTISLTLERKRLSLSLSRAKTVNQAFSATSVSLKLKPYLVGGCAPIAITISHYWKLHLVLPVWTWSQAYKLE